LSASQDSLILDVGFSASRRQPSKGRDKKNFDVGPRSAHIATFRIPRIPRRGAC
jgi:hypothetical protein